MSDAAQLLAFSEEYLPGAVLHHVQFGDIWHGKNRSPERELAAAVIDNAASDLRRYRGLNGHDARRLYEQAHAWVTSDARDWPFSFLNLCAYLQLSPQALRRALLSPEPQVEVRNAA